MSITGAAHLSASIKDKIAAAKSRVANVTQNTDLALAKIHAAADAADQVNKSIEAEADSLLAELGQFTNGSPPSLPIETRTVEEIKVSKMGPYPTFP